MEQFLQQLNILLRLITNEETKNLINNIINTYHLQVGSEADPLQYPKIYSYTDSAWLQEFQTALVEFNVTIHRPHKMSLTPNRINDHNLMDIITKNISNKEALKRINTCRQYVKAIYLSDITNALGTHIDSNYFDSKHHDSNLRWPNVLPPPPIAWETWKKALSQNFCQSHNTTRLKSHMRLGAWLKSTNDLQKNGSMYTQLAHRQFILLPQHQVKLIFFSKKKGIASTS